MSAIKKQKPYEYPNHSDAGKSNQQESARDEKIKVERLRDKLQSSILDNPKTAKKAALLVSLWVNKDGKKTKKKP